MIAGPEHARVASSLSWRLGYRLPILNGAKAFGPVVSLVVV